jgi:hypothetical protein
MIPVGQRHKSREGKGCADRGVTAFRASLSPRLRARVLYQYHSWAAQLLIPSTKLLKGCAHERLGPPLTCAPLCLRSHAFSWAAETGEQAQGCASEGLRPPGPAPCMRAPCACGICAKCPCEHSYSGRLDLASVPAHNPEQCSVCNAVALADNFLVENLKALAS